MTDFKNTNCYNYIEVQDMGAHIPTCRLERKLGKCPCFGCKKFVSKEEINKLISDYLTAKYNALEK